MYKKIIFVILLILVGCSKKISKANIPSPDFKRKMILGSWEIRPASPQQILIIDNNKITLLKGSQAIPMDFNLDSLGIRFYSENEGDSTGYFLFSEKKGTEWPGIWQNEVVHLINTSSQKTFLE